MADQFMSKVLVRPGKNVDLADYRPDEDFGWEREETQLETDRLMAKVDKLQGRLAAEGQHAVLVVLQARDAAGKDGVIRSVFTGTNPAGVKVTSFKVPAGREQIQDYLWRCHLAVPGRGEIGIFNRSHYEDVLVVRVHGLVPEHRWRKRYHHIREFERMLADEGTTIVKLFLDVSKEEQRLRFQDRVDDPDERWKFRLGDLEDRKKWDEYTAAYEDAIAETAAEHAPWFVVPADKKWVRNRVVAQILLDTLERLDPQYPEPEEGIVGLKIT